MYEANAFGRICYFESRFDKYRPKIAKKWKDQNISGSGILYDLLPHLADQTFQLFGCPQYISATLKSQRETNSVCDYFNVKLIYCDFDVVLRASSFAAHTPFRFYIEGNKGTFIKSGMDVQESNLHLDNFNKKDWVSEDIKNSGVFYQNGSAQTITSVQGDYRCFYNNIANALCANGSLLVTVDDAIAVMKLIELVTLSSQSNQVIAWST